MVEVVPPVAWVGGTGSVPVGTAWAIAPQAVASMSARVKFRVTFLIKCSFAALVALRRRLERKVHKYFGISCFGVCMHQDLDIETAEDEESTFYEESGDLRTPGLGSN